MAETKSFPVDPVKWENIVAKPLVSQDFTSVKPKNPNLAFYWGNRHVGEPTGHRIDELLAVGFRPATPNDCEVPGLSSQDNKFIRGDLMLLCIAKDLYLGALKYNQEVSTQRLNLATAAKRGITQEGGGMTTKMFNAGKLAFVHPTEKERDALFTKQVQEAK